MHLMCLSADASASAGSLESWPENRLLLFRRTTRSESRCACVSSPGGRETLDSGHTREAGVQVEGKEGKDVDE